MGEKTKKAIIVSGLRNIWLRSKERSNRLKLDDYTCKHCNRKQSKAKGQEFKVQVHHVNGIEWDELVQLLRDKLLQDESCLLTLCKECHKKEENKIRNNE